MIVLPSIPGGLYAVIVELTQAFTPLLTEKTHAICNEYSQKHELMFLRHFKKHAKEYTYVQYKYEFDELTSIIAE